MQAVKTHIIGKVITLLLALSILLPSGVKLLHAFSHHNHEVCHGEQTTHLHKTDFECKFYKFKVKKPFTLDELIVILTPKTENHQTILSAYHFISDYQRLPFPLRGPPQLI